RIGVAPHAAGWLEHLAVGQHHAAGAALRDREDPQLEAAAALPLEQRWIAPRTRHPDDLVADQLACLGRRVDDGSAPDGGGPLAIDERPLFELAVDFQCETLDLRIRRDGEAEDPFQDL